MKSLFHYSTLYFSIAALAVFAVIFGAHAHSLLAQTDPPVDAAELFKMALSAFSDFRGGALIAGLAVVVNLLTNLTKLPFIDRYISAKARPFIALALGVATAVLAAKVAGQNWVDAIGAGIAAAFGSVFLHEAVQVFITKPQDKVAEVVAAAANGDAAATAKVSALSEALEEVQKLPPDQKGQALVDWAKTHPPAMSVVSGA